MLNLRMTAQASRQRQLRSRTTPVKWLAKGIRTHLGVRIELRGQLGHNCHNKVKLSDNSATELESAY